MNRLITYRRHLCSRTHKTYRTLAACIWHRAHWVDGEGPYATLAHCRGLTVQLHQTLEEAQAAKRVIDQTGCGGQCPCTGAGHTVVRLIEPAEAVMWW